jgi:Zn-dependent peptidase ImmA (M78 family)
MNKINILGIEYTIVEQKIVNANNEYLGLIDTHTQEIFLKKSLPEDKKLQTLYHEVLHAIFAQMGQYDLYENEQVIQQLATAIHQLHKDNDVKGLLEL